MSQTHDDFPDDEFETAGTGLTRSGVHLKKRSTWSKVAPFILVAVLCAGLGAGTIYLLTQNPDSKVSEYLGDVVDTESPDADESDSAGDPATDADAEADSSEDPAAEPTDESSDEPAAEPTEEPADEPTDEPSDEPTSDPTDNAAGLDRSASVRVLNAGAAQGQAGEYASKLEVDGWTNVEATNFEGTKPSKSVIYYRGSENLVNAEHIGELVGISNFLEVASLRADISMVLMR